jgi:hypothetical protein
MESNLRVASRPQISTDWFAVAFMLPVKVSVRPSFPNSQVATQVSDTSRSSRSNAINPEQAHRSGMP